MTAREVLTLNEDVPQIVVPQSGDTYVFPRAAHFNAAITTDSTVDGRDIAADGDKLDLIEAQADVTNSASVEAAGALMDSEVTNLAAVKAFAPGDYATAAQGVFAVSEIFSADVPEVAEQDYVLWYDAPFAGTVTLVRTESTSGTCTLTGKIGSTALGGTANSVSTTAQEQAHASNNTFAKGDVLQFTVSSNSTCLNLAVSFYITRTG